MGHLVQPSCWSRVTFSRLHRTLSRRVLNISREGDSTTSLGSLGQGSVTLRGKSQYFCVTYFTAAVLQLQPASQLCNCSVSNTEPFKPNTLKWLFRDVSNYSAAIGYWPGAAVCWLMTGERYHFLSVKTDAFFRTCIVVLLRPNLQHTAAHEKNPSVTGLHSIGLCQAKAIAQWRSAEFGTQTLSICLV